MSHSGFVGAHADRQPRPAGRPARHHIAAWLILVTVVAMVAVLAVAFVRAEGSRPAPSSIVPAAPTGPADVFMRSIAEDNGSLGWHQLCPSVQVQVPESTLVGQADAERRVRAQQGLTLTVSFIGSHPSGDGGELRQYVVTGHWPNGAILTRIYTVLTQASGCVADVRYQ
jgi:hypothetical protein